MAVRGRARGKHPVWMSRRNKWENFREATWQQTGRNTRPIWREDALVASHHRRMVQDGVLVHVWRLVQKDVT